MDDDLLPDCIDPLNDSTDSFTAIVRDQDGRREKGVKVAFSFGQRNNGNAAGADDSTDDSTLATSEGPEITTNPGTLKTYCVTGPLGRCRAFLENPSPVASDKIVVEANIWGDPSDRASDTATEQWQLGAVNGVGQLMLTPRSASRQLGMLHTVTARLTNQFGDPVQGGDIDFAIVSGPNQGLAKAGMTDSVTNSDGIATFSYASNSLGTDKIRACSETGGSENDTCDGNEPRALASVTWVSS